MTPIRAIFFDIGDTLVFDDPSLETRLQAALRASAIIYEHSRWTPAFRAAEVVSLRRYLSSGLWDDADGLRESLSVLLNGLGVAPGKVTLASLFAVPFTRGVVSGAHELLAELRARGFALGAISDWETTLPAVLAELKLDNSFDALAVSSLVGAVKPSPKLFQNALDQICIPASETLHVGDWYELDVCGARGVGMNALLFDHQNRRPDADCPRVTTFGQLSDWLLALDAPHPPTPSPTLRERGSRKDIGLTLSHAAGEGGAKSLVTNAPGEGTP